ncbi:MAG: DUF11 domain-containing protein [Phycisphaerae bacterium]|nr:DUF11 domain-containing protein [Saprospiraceae bacterium]
MKCKAIQFLIIFLLLLIGALQSSFAQGWEKEIKVPTGKSATTNRLKVLPDGSVLKGAYLSYYNGAAQINQIQLTRIGINGVVYWNRFYEMPSPSWFNGPWMFDLETTADGTIFLAGTVFVGNDRQVQVWRLKPSGQTVWIRTFGLASRLEAVEDMGITAEGDVVIAGTDETRPFLLKVKPNGTQVWLKYLSNSTAGGAKGMAISPNGNIGITGSSSGNAYIALLSSDATLLWQTTYPYRGQNFAIAAMPNGSWVVCGNYIEEPTIDFDPFLMCADANGTLLWEHHDGPDNSLEVYTQVVVAQNNDIYVAGWVSEVPNAGGIIARFNEHGNLLSNHLYGQPSRREYLDDVALHPEGGLVGAGRLEGINTGWQGWTFRTTSGGVLNNNLLEGKLFSDLDNDCIFDAGSEMPVPNRFLNIRKGNDISTLSTDADGNYKISVDTGHFELSTEAYLNYWKPCPGTYTVDFHAFNGTAQLDYPLTPEVDCPDMTIDISTSLLRRCFPAVYTVSYCNNGTVTAEDAYVDIFLPSEITYISATISPTLIMANTYRFHIGDVAPLQCGSFFLTAQVGCDNVQNDDVLCVSAQIYPDTNCVQPSPLWSGAALEITGHCDGDTIAFIVRNIGTGNMAEQKSFVVTRGSDNFWQTPILLTAGEALAFKFEAGSEVWHAEIEQESYFPRPSHPSATIDACNGSFTNTDMLQFATDDGENTLERDCRQVVGSWDPNDKVGSPFGVGSGHAIRPNTELEYHIRFQNTGTDTAFTVVIRDTLSPFLDHSTLKIGTASHPYDYNLRNGVLEVVFNDILLPDSNVNEIASHGFVNFRISQLPNLIPNTSILNQAAIFFDFNKAVLTNSTFHTVTPIVTSASHEPNNAQTQGNLQIFPNPGVNKISLHAPSLYPDGQVAQIRLQFWRNDGVFWQEYLLNPLSPYLSCEDWPIGTYFYRAIYAGDFLGYGKFIKI